MLALLLACTTTPAPTPLDGTVPPGPGAVACRESFECPGLWECCESDEWPAWSRCWLHSTAGEWECDAPSEIPATDVLHWHEDGACAEVEALAEQRTCYPEHTGDTGDTAGL